MLRTVVGKSISGGRVSAKIPLSLAELPGFVLGRPAMVQSTASGRPKK
jgi:hypothetical protein